MSRYELLLIAHVLGVVVWLGSSITNVVLLARANASSELQRLVLQVESGRWVDLRLGMPAALVVLLAGGWLMAEGDWPFDTALWIHIGMGALLGAAGIAIVWTGPHQRRLLRLAAGGGNSLALHAMASRIMFGSVASIALILVALWAMIDKPTF